MLALSVHGEASGRMAELRGLRCQRLTVELVILDGWSARNHSCCAEGYMKPMIDLRNQADGRGLVTTVRLSGFTKLYSDETRRAARCVLCLKPSDDLRQLLPSMPSTCKCKVA